jgi:hypothetical protein
LEEHIQWSHLNGYLNDRPSQSWVVFQAGQMDEETSPGTGTLSPQELLIGTWKGTNEIVDATFEFRPDGIVVYTVDGQAYESDLEFRDEDTLLMTSWKGRIVMDFRFVNDDELEMTTAGATEGFVRVK